MKSSGLKFPRIRRVAIALLLATLPAVASAQTVAVDPRLVEFLPSPESSVTGYAMDISRAGSTQVLQRVHLGKPAVSADGMIRTNFLTGLSAPLAAGVQYVSTIVALSPTGSATSVASNAFTFSPCAYQLSATSASLPAAGGSGAVNLVVTSGASCAWTAVSSAPWLTITSGASGTASGTVAFSAAANASGSTRSAALTIAGLTFTVTQAASSGPQTIEVSTEAELQSALRNVTSNSTIVLAPGTYQLTQPATIAGSLSGVVIRGATGDAADVVLQGAGMTNGAVPVGLWVKEGVTGLRVAGLSIRNVSQHAILLEGGVQTPRLSNLWLLDSGDALIKAAINGAGAGVNGGVLENSTLEYATGGLSAAAGGLDLRGAAGWTVRDSTFRNVTAPAGQTARPAVRANTGSRDTIVERNRFINCHVGVALGLLDQPGGFDHRGGSVMNNMFYRSPAQTGGPAIIVADSPDTKVVHNTVVHSGTHPSTIQVRFPESSVLVVANNLLDGPVLASDGGSVVQYANITNATAALFVNAEAGDLHLQPSATAAIDKGDPGIVIEQDIDRDPRPQGTAPDAGADEVDAFNANPTVRIVAPANGTTLDRNKFVQLEADAQDADGRIAYVEFYVNSSFLGRVSAAPYTMRWRTQQAGSFSLVAVAVDDAGGRTSSAPVTVVVSKSR